MREQVKRTTSGLRARPLGPSSGRWVEVQKAEDCDDRVRWSADESTTGRGDGRDRGRATHEAMASDPLRRRVVLNPWVAVSRECTVESGGGHDPSRGML